MKLIVNAVLSLLLIGVLIWAFRIGTSLEYMHAARKGLIPAYIGWMVLPLAALALDKTLGRVWAELDRRRYARLQKAQMKGHPVKPE